MALPLNRTAIFLDLVVFVGAGVLCISTQAPLMQQDILKRCQDALLLRHIPVQGLAVHGRDVILTGPANDPITSVRAKSALAMVRGVRTVRTVITPGPTHSPSSESSSGASIGPEVPESSTNPVAPGTGQERDVQEKIDQVLDHQAIGFSKDVAVLTPESIQALDKIADILGQAPNLFCEIRGYDSEPRENRPSWILALQRVLAVEGYLQSLGVADWRLSTVVLQTGEGREGRRTDRSLDLVVKAR